jgi:hypothetical protein
LSDSRDGECAQTLGAPVVVREVAGTAPLRFVGPVPSTFAVARTAGSKPAKQVLGELVARVIGSREWVTF